MATLNTETPPSAVARPAEVVAKITAIRRHLTGVIDTVNSDHAHGRVVLNGDTLFPVAEEFVQGMADANEAIFSTYIDYLEHGGSKTSYSQAVERQGMRIFELVRQLIDQAKMIESPEMKEREAPSSSTPRNQLPLDGFIASPKNAKVVYRELQTKRGPLQMELFEQAKRLGPQGGAQFMQAAESAFLASIDMLRAINGAGIDVNMNRFPGKEARFENFGFAPPPDHTALRASVDAPALELPEVEPARLPSKREIKD